MKIIFILSSTFTYGGGTKAFMQMLLGVMQHGIKPLVILPDKQGIYDTLIKNGIPCAALQFHYRMSVYPWRKTFLDKLLFLPRFFGRVIVNSLATIQLLKITKQFKPNIIHTNVSVIAIGYYVASILKIPHIWHIREYGDLDFNLHYYPSRQIQLNRYKRYNSYTLCITKDIQRHHNLQQWENSLVVYDGVLSNSMISYQKDKFPYFIFAGRLEKAKGILPLLDAYAIYCKKHPAPLSLYIAGSGSQEYTQIVRDKILQHNIEDKVILLGMRDDILTLYQQARALIVPSFSEGFGFITAEAMFSGCLVIGNDTAGTKEQFDNGKELTGEEIALRYTTQEQLVQHMIDVTNNNIEYYEPMIFRAQRIVAQLYSTEAHAQQVHDFHKQIINK